MILDRIFVFLFAWFGRCNRIQFLYFNLSWLAVGTAMWALDRFLPINSLVYILLAIVLGALFFISTVTISVRRLHDVNLSGWWLAPLIIISTYAEYHLGGIQKSFQHLINMRIDWDSAYVAFRMVIMLLFMTVPGTRDINMYDESHEYYDHEILEQ